MVPGVTFTYLREELYNHGVMFWNIRLRVPMLGLPRDTHLRSLAIDLNQWKIKTETYKGEERSYDLRFIAAREQDEIIDIDTTNKIVDDVRDMLDEARETTELLQKLNQAAMAEFP